MRFEPLQEFIGQVLQRADNPSHAAIHPAHGLMRRDNRKVVGRAVGSCRTVAHHYRSRITAYRHPAPRHTGRCPTGVRIGVIRYRFIVHRNVVVQFAPRKVVGQYPCRCNFVFGRFSQRDPYRVANPVSQQGSDTHGRTDTPVLPLTRFGHPQVQRVVHPLGIHRHDQFSVGLDHHPRVARLHRDNHAVVALGPTHPQKLHGRLHHPVRRISVARHDTVRQRTVVHTDAYHGIVILAHLNQCRQLHPQPLQLRRILRIGIVHLLERSPAVDKVAGVNPHLAHILRRNEGHLGIEVNVGHQRHVTLTLLNPSANGQQAFGFGASGRREPNHVGSGGGYAHHLFGRSLHVGSIGGSHRLNHYRCIAPQHQVAADANRQGSTAAVAEQVGTVTFHCEAQITSVRLF